MKVLLVLILGLGVFSVGGCRGVPEGTVDAATVTLAVTGMT